MSKEWVEKDTFELGDNDWLKDAVQSTWLTINYARTSDEQYDAEQRAEGVPDIGHLSDQDLILLSIAARLNGLYELMHAQAWMIQTIVNRELARAQRAGRPRGTLKRFNAEQVADLYRHFRCEPGDTLVHIARELGVSRATAGRYISKARALGAIHEPDPA